MVEKAGCCAARQELAIMHVLYSYSRSALWWIRHMVPSSHKARQGYSATSSATDMQQQQHQPNIRYISVTDKAPFSQLFRVGGFQLVAKTTTALTELLYLSCLSAD